MAYQHVKLTNGATFAASHERWPRHLLAKLSRCMYLEQEWPAPASDALEPWENPAIPSGYTYLLQFLAHDCVASSIPTSALRANSDIRNNRAAPLRLQTLYGTGFDACAHAISKNTVDPLVACKLPLGAVRLETLGTGKCPFRDIARSEPFSIEDAERRRSKPQLPDDRNDNNAIVSQITVLFSLLHNCLVDRLGADLIRKTRAGNPPDQSAYTRLF